MSLQPAILWKKRRGPPRYVSTIKGKCPAGFEDSQDHAHVGRRIDQS
jgi:hypothetical protein